MKPRADRRVRCSARLDHSAEVKAAPQDAELQAALARSAQSLAHAGNLIDKLQALAAEPNRHPEIADVLETLQERIEDREERGVATPVLRLLLSQLVSYFGGVVEWPNDPSSATRPTRALACNREPMAGFAAAHG